MMVKENLCLSSLAHTWVLDFDGTLVKHNGYKTGNDEWLPGALDFLKSIPEQDFILILTAREPEAREITESFLNAYGVRVNKILFGIPMGERILMNDTKPSGLKCAYAINPGRNVGPINFAWNIDQSL